ncbi:MAG: DNA alkylation repair protein [Rhizobiaceae bacterium]|nr:DNA alkylation repair protein [Rhizobiaceae bacterium]
MARTPHTPEQALKKLRHHCVPQNRAGMARFGIEIEKALGVSMPNIRQVGKEITPDHDLAEQLWQSEIHEARILASLVDRPKWVKRSQMDRWAADFNSWDLCDQVCGNLFDRSPFAHEKIIKWATQDKEFVKRAAFATIAWRAVHDKKIDDQSFIEYFTLIETASCDERNFVKKAVNWALRQIGKRSSFLYHPALSVAARLAVSTDKSARWIGKNAEKELKSVAIRKRLHIT